jgi:methylmalonyl-CoA/ethylmalonyl-CoA epimerase
MLQAPGFRFHHLGLACRDLERELGTWLRLGYRPDGEAFVDPVQKVRGQFITGLGPRLELLAPAGPGSPVEGVLERGGNLYHQGFEALDFDAALAALREAGVRMIHGPSPAVAFGGRRIAFLMTPTLNLIEIIEAPE